jgi:hypothetical protein
VGQIVIKIPQQHKSNFNGQNKNKKAKNYSALMGERLSLPLYLPFGMPELSDCESDV